MDVFLLHLEKAKDGSKDGLNLLSYETHTNYILLIILLITSVIMFYILYQKTNITYLYDKYNWDSIIENIKSRIIRQSQIDGNTIKIKRYSYSLPYI